MIARAIYDAIEEDIGDRLVPSPWVFGWTASAWRRRMADWTPEARREAFATARALGHGFGLTDKTVVYGRLDQVFDLAEVAPELVNHTGLGQGSRRLQG